MVDNIDGTFSDRHSKNWGKLIEDNVIDDNLLQNYDSIFHHPFFLLSLLNKCVEKSINNHSRIHLNLNHENILTRVLKAQNKFAYSFI